MPPAKIKFIISSSESEPGYGPENLLDGPSKRTKWKGKAGTENNVVVLQLEREHQLTSVDIGNEYSALIEVFVSRSIEKDQKFSTLIPSTSFMSPMDSRTEKNGNRVRVFSELEMVAAIAKQKWDVVKIVCSQPFNKNIPYGLSFATFVVEDGSESPRAKQALPKIPLKLRQTKEDLKFSLSAGAMFKQRQSFTSSPEAEQSTSKGSETKDGSLTKTDRKRKGDDGFASDKPKSDNRLTPKKKHSKTTTADGIKKMPAQSFSESKASDFSQPGPSEALSESDGGSGVKTGAENKPNVPFNKVMDGVRFCLSGYENPLRGVLREKALDMGAEYKRDWSPACTHLVCAFPNTPKWKQVRNKGVIVTGKWIQMCHARKKRLPEDKFLCK